MCIDSNIPGIFIDNRTNSSISGDVLSINILMYADDICAVNDTIGRIQSQMNILQSFCGKYGLAVNLNKTKLMVFRNGGILKRNEKVYFKGERLEYVNSYKYLGLTMSPTLHWNVAIKTLRKQAEKAVLCIKLLGNQCGHLPLNVAFKLFDSKVLPILCYGSEIWGSHIWSDIEIVQNQFCKYVLGLGPRSVNVAALAECGRKPLYVHYMTKCIKYWLKLLSMEPGRYPKECYKMLLNFDSVGRKTWATDIKYILYSNGFGDAWQNQGVWNDKLFIKLFEQRITDIAHQGMYAEIGNTSKLHTYSLFKLSLTTEKYLDVINWKRHVKALARFRCSNHNLAIERQRGILSKDQQRKSNLQILPKFRKKKH